MPERTCICCRNKGEKENFFRISKIEAKYVFDVNMKIQSRGFYICKTQKCIERLSKHKKYNVEISELLKMLEILKKEEKKNIINILQPMVNSPNFVFGVDENIDAIKKNKVRLLVLPKNINEKYIQTFETLKNEFGINIIMIEKKEEFLTIFSRDVNVVGITNKKVVNGILKEINLK